jgi:N-acetyltransferase
VKPQPVTMQGHRVRLEPLAHRHASDLLKAAAHDEIWTYLDEPTPRTPGDIDRLITDALADQQLGKRLPFAIVRVSDNVAVGSTSYIDIRPADRTMEIGWIWLDPETWGTGINAEAEYLLLRHAFEDLGAGRVSFKADARNARSRKAIEKLGATYEGIWRNHRLLSTGDYRDSAWYSIIDTEWPTISERLRQQSA